MVFPDKKKYEYKIKAPGVKGVFFLRAHYLENEVDYHAKLTLNPLGIKIPWGSMGPKIPKLEYEARSTCDKEFLYDLFCGNCRWADAKPGQYRFYERDGIKSKELSYTIEKEQVISVRENGESLREIGIPSHRKVPFLDPLQFIAIAGGMIENLDLDGILVAGKYREANLEEADESEYSLSWMQKEKQHDIHLLLNRREQLVQTLAYKLPLMGKIIVDLDEDLSGSLEADWES